MTGFQRRILPETPRAASKPYEMVSQALQDWMDKVRDSLDNGMPAGAGIILPEAIAAGDAGAVGLSTDGWSPASHRHPVPTGIPAPIGGPQAQGVSTSLPRLDHVHGIPLSTKGDIFVFGSAGARLPVGVDGTILTANSLAALGLDYEQGPDLTNQLCGMWRMEEATGSNRNDWWGLNHLAPTNGPTQVAGQVGNACHFAAASSQLLSVASSPLLVFGSGVPALFDLWFHVDSLGANRTILFKGTNSLAAATFEYVLVVSNVGVVSFTISDGVTTHVAFPGSVNAGETHHLTVYYDPVSQKLFTTMDHGPIFNYAGGTGIQSGAGTFQVGADLHPAAGNYMDGWVDALYIAKRVPTPIELEMLWNGGLGREILVPGHL